MSKDSIIDGLAGFPAKFTKEIQELKSELYDSNGLPLKPEADKVGETIVKANRYVQLLQKRNVAWAAALN